MSKTLVSCVMPTTAGRLPLALQSLEYFRRQTHPELELVVVFDGRQRLLGETQALIRRAQEMKLRFMYTFDSEVARTVGAKLNLGIANARGSVIHRWDDDDWYHPEAVERGLRALGSRAGLSHADGVVAAPGHYYSLDVGRWEVRRQGPGCFPGGMLCFTKRTWTQNKFREDLVVGEDVEFRRGLREVRWEMPWSVPAYALVRHGSNTWREQDGVSVEDHLGIRGQPYEAGPEGLFNPTDLGFYRGLRRRLSVESA